MQKVIHSNLQIPYFRFIEAVIGTRETTKIAQKEV
jgi:hypothetical protein